MAKWVYKPGHPRANERGFVAYEDLGVQEESLAINAPIVTDRFYENTKSPVDGSDIGSRRKHRDHMKRYNLTIASDFKGTWEKAAVDRESIRSGTHDTKERRQQIERAWYERNK